MKHLSWATMAVLGLFAIHATADQLLVVDGFGGVGRVMLFDASDGTLVEENWITDVGLPFTFFTPKEAAHVGQEIWISDQVRDAIFRFDLDSNYLGSITTFLGDLPLDNLRGMGVSGDRVYLAHWPTTSANRGIAVYDFAGTPVDFLPLNLSLFDAEPYQGGLLMSNSTNNSVRLYSLTGVEQSIFAAGFSTPQQVVILDDNSVLVAGSLGGTEIRGIYHFESDATLRAFIPATLFGNASTRGAYLLGDGAYFVATASGLYKVRAVPGGGWDAINVYPAANGQYVTLLRAPGPVLCAGDLNCDGVVNFADISPFIAAIKAGSPDNWPVDCPWLNGDLNGDGTVNFADISGFIAQIKTGHVCP